MKIAIVHITDIHFTERTTIQNKIHSLSKAISYDSAEVLKVYLVLSGDIAFSGKASEYVNAKEFLGVLKRLLSHDLPGIEIKFIIVPGNHDCNFYSHNSQIRINAIGSMNYSTLGKDNSVADACLEVQKEFWDFYSNYNSIPTDKLFYKISDFIGKKEINFYCLNTAWISQLDEQPGQIFFPVKKYEDSLKGVKGLSFGVWHHPYSWFNPNTNENNKIEFEKFTETLSSTHFYGHEHVQSSYSNENLNSGLTSNLLSGFSFNEDRKPEKSGFQILVIDMISMLGNLKVYSWNVDIYTAINEVKLNLVRESKEIFDLKIDFKSKLQEIKIPIIFENRKDLKLDDIFVFPDIEYNGKETESFENYVNSKDLMNIDSEFCILDGESQVGKSSLLSMLYLTLNRVGVHSVMLKGSDIKELDVDKISRRAFREQYSKQQSDYDRFVQLDKSKKSLLIDDLQTCGLNPESVRKFLEGARLRFGKIIVTCGLTNGLASSLRTNVKDAKHYTIKPLGYKKRNELIEKYLHIKHNSITIDEQIFLDEVKEVYNNVQSIIGDKLMPAYPVYILSIIQALQYKPLQQNETSFGYCYQTLIHYSLHKAGVNNDSLDTYFNFLTELAYEIIESDNESISTENLLKFYQRYSSEFIIDGYENIISTLKVSKLIQSQEGNYKFCYNYIMYYLSAKKISDIMNTKEGKATIERLFKDMHEEKNANILVFVTHHSKDISFIESSIFSMMEVLEDTTAITLEKSDKFYKDISDFVETLKNDIIEDINPIDERNRQLTLQDEESRKRNNAKKTDDSSDSEHLKVHVMPFMRAFRSIEIVGQILKNRKGSLKIAQMRTMLTELYTTAFRTVGYYGEVLEDIKFDIIDLIKEKIGSKDDKFYIEQKVNNFIRMNSFNMMLNVFIKLMHCAGNRELKDMYLDVAAQMNTPAAKIITFSINSYHGTINPKDLKSLADEFEGNIVALRLLKARVASYVYNRKVEYDTKQKLASILKMTLAPKAFKAINK